MKEKQIAIVGISLRFPGADTVDQFWQNLMDGVESVERYDEAEMNRFGVHIKSQESEQFVRASARLHDIDQFDHNFFNYSPKDAALVDPQQRLLLECGHEALEDAGIPVGNQSHEVGVFAGAYVSNYLMKNLGSMVAERSREEDHVPYLYQCETDHLATNLAYRLNLTGPSISVQSWCTTAFSALYLGSRAISNGDCETALVGAANICVPQEGYFAPEGGLWSISGKTRSFDQSGDGCVSGSGVAVVVLKELEAAQRDRNQIYAILKGVAVNNDGKSNAKLGYHGATVEGQYQAITKTMSQSGVLPKAITYLEANGLATPLADRMEIKALSKAFKNDEGGNKPWLGSIKPNIGHLLSASGMAALIKSCLICKYRRIPPLINHEKFSKVNQRMVDLNFQVNHEAVDLSKQKAPILCGMNSFGIGGSNAHAIIEEAPIPLPEKTIKHPPAHLLTWSGKSKSATDQIKKSCYDFLADLDGQINLSDLSFTLNAGKGQMLYRDATVVRTADDLRKLNNQLSDPLPVKSDTVWLFSGYGDTYPLEKFRTLYDFEPVFRDIIDQFFNRAETRHSMDFRSFFQQASIEKLVSKEAEIKNNIFTIVLNYAYGKLLLSWGIRPAKMIGISNGEYTAACLAGVFSFRAMIDVVIQQSKLIAKLPEGRMITVFSQIEALTPLLDAYQVDLGGEYLPEVQVVSGSVESCDALCDQLTKKGIEYLGVDASYAFHSRAVEPILPKVQALYEDIAFQTPSIPLVSTVTGKVIAEEIMEPAYWSRKMRAPVLFSASVAQIDAQKSVLLEIGPDRKLSPVLKSLFHDVDVACYQILSIQSEDAYTGILELLGKVWKHGIDVNWKQFHSDKPGKMMSLPHYPFERQSFWLDYSADQTLALNSSSTHAHQSQKQPFDKWFYTPSWKPLIEPIRNAQPLSAGEVKTWMVFTNGDAYTLGMISWLQEQQQRVITVTQNEKFEGEGLHIKTNPHDPAGMDQVFEAISSHNIIPDHVLYFWCFGGASKTNAYQTLAYATVIKLVSGLDKIKSGKSWSLFVGTNNLFKLQVNDLTEQEKSLIIGPVRTIPNEFENVTCQLIDLSSSLDYVELTCLAQSSHSRILAERHGKIFKQYLEPLEVSGTQATPFKSEATYLITGGLGGIGAHISHHLLALFPGISLVIVGRTPIEKAQSQQAYQQLSELAKQKGSQLAYYAVDIGDEAQVKHWTAKVCDEYPHIRGVIHLAGVQGGGLMSFHEKRPEEPAFSAKVTGTQLLIDAFKDKSLEFFIMSSSNSAWFGFFGLLDYSTANAYMDQLANQLNQQSETKYISINWDMWDVEGMGSGTGLGAAVEALREQNKAYAISAQHGIQALQQILQWELPQVAVLTRKPEDIANDSNLKQETITSDEAVSTIELDASENLESYIVQLWERIFERSDIEPNSNFFQLGGHSLSGVMFINKMKSQFPNLELSLNEIFDYPTPKVISELIEERTRTNTPTKSNLKERLLKCSPQTRISLLENHFLKEFNKLLPSQITIKSVLNEVQLSQVANHLYFHLKTELDLPLYAYELSQYPVVEELAAYIAHEFEIFYGLLPQTSEGNLPTVKAGPKIWKRSNQPSIKQAVFICSAPRAGSTLLRLMLAGHSKLFAPPELWLLGSQSMRSWSEDVPGHVIQHGGVNAILKSLGGLSDQQAQKQIQSYIKEDRSCFDVFAELRGLAKEQFFIDKTPNYYKDPHVFDRIEDGFEQAKYIHLIRHPYATIDSIVKNRIYSLYEAFKEQPLKAAEHIWYTHNLHIRHFLTTVDSSRTLVLHYEDLVTNPTLSMKRVCNFLGLGFEPKMTQPYATGNLIAGDGDPNILNHDDIDPVLAEAWKAIKFQPELTQATESLASNYQYPMIIENTRTDKATGTDQLVSALDEEDLDDLISQLG